MASRPAKSYGCPFCEPRVQFATSSARRAHLGRDHPGARLLSRAELQRRADVTLAEIAVGRPLTRAEEKAIPYRKLDG